MSEEREYNCIECGAYFLQEGEEYADCPECGGEAQKTEANQ